ncbi:MAG: DUF1800 domain-containing protein [Thermoanaerobaculia bacterium]
MKLRARTSTILCLLAAAITVAASAGASGPDRAAALCAREQALHVLNRLGFGPRPGDVERVLQMGVGKYIDQQLDPEKIADGAVAARLAAMPTLAMSNAELFDKFERPMREARRQRKAEAGEGQDVDLEKLKAMIPPEKRPRRIIEELSVARVIRAADSQRQLNEVMADFWMNHFNVFAAKGLDRVFLTSFERDVVRPRIWGKFEDLLMATAKSPAMLFYLDNARSVADEEHRSPEANRRAALFGRREEKAPKGINENYARELMELHTLGVDGGYTQKDVTQLARVLTGWSIGQGGRRFGRGEGAGEFVFRAAMHDVGSKTVLGVTLPSGGGIEEGEKMIRFLALQPATARHIAYQLCQRLVADDPPQALVDRVAKTFLASAGDLRETVRAVVTSPEFSDPKSYRAKVKSPFEYVVSAVRAMGGSTDGRALARQLAQMGEPLYLCQPPTGYSDRADAWVNSGALIARLNFALALAAGQLPGTSTEPQRLISEAQAQSVDRSVDALARVLLGGGLSESTREAIRQRLATEQNAQAPVSLIAGLILGSPEFQRQ